MTDEQNFAHRGKMRQNVPEHGSRDIPFIVAQLSRQKSEIFIMN